MQHARQREVVGVAAAPGHGTLRARARQRAADVAVGLAEQGVAGSCRSRPAAPSPRRFQRGGRRHRRWRDSRCSGSSCRTGTSGSPPCSWAAARASSSAAVISMPGVQKPHCRALRATNAACRSAISPRVVQAFDGHHLAAVGLHRQHQAAAHDDAVDAHRAGAADAMLAAQMRTRETQLGAQEIDQMLAHGHRADDTLAVDGERDRLLFPRAHAAARAR